MKRLRLSCSACSAEQTHLVADPAEVVRISDAFLDEHLTDEHLGPGGEVSVTMGRAEVEE